MTSLQRDYLLLQMFFIGRFACLLAVEVSHSHFLLFESGFSFLSCSRFISYIIKKLPIVIAAISYFKTGFLVNKFDAGSVVTAI
jgi:hypothetical protein